MIRLIILQRMSSKEKLYLFYKYVICHYLDCVLYRFERAFIYIRIQVKYKVRKLYTFTSTAAIGVIDPDQKDKLFKYVLNSPINAGACKIKATYISPETGKPIEVIFGEGDFVHEDKQGGFNGR